jgi:c-di-GMP-binding flagellar brake protein YcgR
LRGGVGRATIDGMAQVSDRRRAPRVELVVACTLHRRSGPPISCETVDVGTGGMSVCSERPLAPDELVSFDLARVELSGRARVLRQHGHRLYALRFEQLTDAARGELEQLVKRAA